jgi:hypothetical protein
VTAISKANRASKNNPPCPAYQVSEKNNGRRLSLNRNKIAISGGREPIATLVSALWCMTVDGASENTKKKLLQPVVSKDNLDEILPDRDCNFI